MSKICTVTTNFQLRASNPVVRIGCGNVYHGTQGGTEYTFVLQTFGVEKKEVITYKATTELLESKDFIGLNPDAEFENANYNATIYTDKEGNTVFQGTETKVPTYDDERSMPSLTEIFK